MVKKFEKEFKQFAQLFGKNGSFLSNMQVRNGLSIHDQDLTSQPVSFLTNFLNGKTNFFNGDNFKGAKLRQYKEHLCVPRPDLLVDSVLSRLLPSSCLPRLIPTLSLARILSLSLSLSVGVLSEPFESKPSIIALYPYTLRNVFPKTRDLLYNPGHLAMSVHVGTGTVLLHNVWQWGLSLLTQYLSLDFRFMECICSSAFCSQQSETIHSLGKKMLYTSLK